jgi:hypothetical protein
MKIFAIGVLKKFLEARSKGASQKELLRLADEAKRTQPSEDRAASLNDTVEVPPR